MKLAPLLLLLLAAFGTAGCSSAPRSQATAVDDVYHVHWWLTDQQDGAATAPGGAEVPEGVQRLKAKAGEQSDFRAGRQRSYTIGQAGQVGTGDAPYVFVAREGVEGSMTVTPLTDGQVVIDAVIGLPRVVAVDAAGDTGAAASMVRMDASEQRLVTIVTPGVERQFPLGSGERVLHLIVRLPQE